MRQALWCPAQRSRSQHGDGLRASNGEQCYGDYSLVNISPGSYIASVSKEGFSTQKEAEFILAVNQTAGKVHSALRVEMLGSRHSTEPPLC